MNNRYIALTDINKGIEVDDIQSLIRLFLYADEIDIEGIIVTSSCFVHGEKVKKNLDLVKEYIDYYEEDYSKLKVHGNYPSPDYLRKITKLGLTRYGKRAGKDFASLKIEKNEGVDLIIESILKDDERKLYIGVRGGALTLAQALFLLENRLSEEEFLNKVVNKIWIYSISDQDNASLWIRNHFKGKINFICSPSKGTISGARQYYKATWPGISADKSSHGSENGKDKTKGFKGANFSLVSNAFIKEKVKFCGVLGKNYPLSNFIMEGDTPSLLWVINNGLNEPDHIEYGGWGGRYVYQKVDNTLKLKDKDLYPLYTGVSDSVLGNDDKIHTSPQATIWRFREAFQNDFLAKLNYLNNPNFEDCSHPLVIKIIKNVDLKDEVKFSFEVINKDKGEFELNYFLYKDVTNYQGDIDVSFDLVNSNVTLKRNERTSKGDVHLVLEIKNKSKFYFVRYARVIVHVI